MLSTEQNMKARHRKSRMALVQMLLFIAAPGARGLLSVRSPFQARISTSLCSEASTFHHAETKSENSIEEIMSPQMPSSDSSVRKRLGKSSFLYRHLTGGPNINVTSGKDLRRTAEQHSGKIIGSSQYKKAWTRWLYLAVEAIREDLGKQLLQQTESERDENGEDLKEAFEKLLFDLGVAADEGTMPSFENEAARKGYALEFFCRGRALAEFLLETPSTSAEDALDGGCNMAIYPRFWNQALRSPDCPLLGTGTNQSPTAPEQTTYEIVSLGGGPGFDFVGVALAAAFSFHTTASTSAAAAAAADDDGTAANIHVTSMDYEEGWSDLVTAMDQSTRNILTSSTDEESSFPSSRTLPAISCDWGGKCDITKSILHEPVNAHCKRLLMGCDNNREEACARLWICQYCVAENARALRESDFIFFKELVQEMPEGTMVLLTEVVPRLWPEMVRLLHKEGLLPTVDVGFRRGYGGKQFLLRKRSTRRGAKSTLASDGSEKDGGAFASLDEKTRDQLEHFERLASYHERKVGSGWKRQGRKANGSTYHEKRLRREHHRIEQK